MNKQAVAPPPLVGLVRFGVFEVDLRTPELRRGRDRIKLQQQPFELLCALLERHGEVVTREELRQRLWDPGTFVDVDAALNTAVKKLREALSDSAEAPRYIETIPRLGYRFIFPVEEILSPPADARDRTAPWGWALTAVAIIAVGLAAAWLYRARQPRSTPIRSIAVLPLRNVSGDVRQEFFADGMTEALITHLGKIGALRIISYQTMSRYRQSNKSMAEITRELHVDAVLVGSVGRTENEVRIDVQLVQPDPERQLWSESFLRPSREVLSLQNDVARAIAERIEVTLTPQERHSLATSRPVAPEAYESWLRGRLVYGEQHRLDDYNPAVEYLQRAVAQDPTYAAPYATLACVYASEMQQGYESMHPLATAAAAKALELDETLAEAHAAQGLVYLRFHWDWETAERELLRAVELNPSSVDARQSLGFYLILMGRFDDGIEQFRRTVELDPLNVYSQQRLGWAYGKAGRQDEELRHMLELAKLEPANEFIQYELAHVYTRKRMYREAMEAVKKGGCRGACGWVIATAGGRDDAYRIARELENESKRRYVDPGFIAATYAGLGEKDKAIAWLEAGYRHRSRFMIFIGVMQEFDSLRDDPRFQDILRRMRLPDRSGIGGGVG